MKSNPTENLETEDRSLPGKIQSLINRKDSRYNRWGKTNPTSFRTTEAQLLVVELMFDEVFAEVELDFFHQVRRSKWSLLKGIGFLTNAEKTLDDRLKRALEIANKEYHRKENKKFKLMSSFESEVEAALRDGLAKRHLVAFQSTSSGRGNEVAKLAETYIRVHAEPQLSKGVAEARANADKQLQGAKEFLKLVCSEKYEDQMKSMIGKSIAGRGYLENLVKTMVDSGTIYINSIAERAHHSGFAWAWIEDSDRFDRHPATEQSDESEPFIFYNCKVSSMIEAHYLVLQAGSDKKFATVEIDVGQKLFHQHTKRKYVVDLQKMVQRNGQTKFERKVCRLRRSTSMSSHSFEAARKAADKAVEACHLAELEEHKAIHLQKDRAKTICIPTAWKATHPNDESIGPEGIRMSWQFPGWTMSWIARNTRLYQEVFLKPGSREYLMVAKFFNKSAASFPIQSIWRIQNILLWNMYDHQRKMVGESPLNKGNPNEDYLWHGSCALEKVIVGGFDAECSRHKPKGVWLSTTANYSAGFCPGVNGVKRILLVRCTLGYIGSIRGESQLSKVNGCEVDSHHCGLTSVGHNRRDDQVGGGRDNRYVINRNNQIYPAYVVQFKAN